MMSTLLLVEDNEDDAFFMKRALKRAGISHPLHHVTDGREAIAYLAGQGDYANRSVHPFPALVFLDLNLPYTSGLQVLEWIRQQPQFARLIVIALTSSSETIDLQRAYRLGANSYVVKPPAGEQLAEIAHAFKRWWLDINRFDIAPGPIAQPTLSARI